MNFDQEYEDSIMIPDEFYNAWHNKLYHGKHKNLKIIKVRRGDERCIAISIDPMIFLAFTYDINYCDRLYKISAPARRWKSSKEIDDMSGKERKRYKALQQQYSNYGITNCAVYVTFSNHCPFKHTNGDGTSTLIEGFHPEEVDTFFENKKN